MLALLDGRMSVFSCVVGSLNAATLPPALQTHKYSVCSAGIPLSLLGSFSASSPFLKAPVGSAIITLSFHGCVILPTALFLYRSTLSTTGPIHPGHQVQRARPPFNSSLRAPAGKRSNSVPADGILQESCYLLTVLLQVKRTCLHPSRTAK